jgi:hypothetical protein
MGAPTGRGDEKRVEQPAVTAVFSLQVKARIKQTRAGTVVKIAAILIVVPVDAETAIANLNTRNNGIIPNRIAISVAGSLARSGRGLRTSSRLLRAQVRDDDQRDRACREIPPHNVRLPFHLKNTGLVREP